MKKSYLLILVVLLFALAFCLSPLSAQTITTIAGTNGNGLHGRSYGFLDRNLLPDTSGDLYFIDYSYYDIIKMNISTGIMAVIAGDGSQGFSGDGGLATAAQLNNPQGLDRDAAGNIYIADTYNGRVRKVNVSTGLITTVAGNGYGGYSGDGGQATAAEINAKDVTLDSVGNMYITGSNVIRRVDKNTGVITSVVGKNVAGFSGDGGPATAAEVNNAEGVSFDKQGNMYITDVSNYRIRKVNANTGIISTCAGTNWYGYTGDGGPATAAEINCRGIATIDQSGNLLIPDYGRIRIVNHSTGVINTIAGNGTESYSGDGGPATAAEVSPVGLSVDKKGNIYDADFAVLRVINGTTGIITTIAGDNGQQYNGDSARPGTAVELYSPYDIANDSYGNIYIADAINARVRKVNASTGIITTIAGCYTGGYTGDGGPATAAEIGDVAIMLDSVNNVYLTDRVSIRKVNATTGTITTIAGNHQWGYSGDGGQASAAEMQCSYIAMDKKGNIYISDQLNFRVRKITASTGIINTIAGDGLQGHGNDNVQATAEPLYQPEGITLDAAGNIYFVDWMRVRKINQTTGIITAYAGNGDEGFSGDGGPATAAELGLQPYGVYFDNVANCLYIADEGNNKIRKVDNATGIITSVAGNGFGAEGVGNFSGDGGPATAAELGGPMAVHSDLYGKLYIAEVRNSKVRKVTPCNFSVNVTVQNIKCNGNLTGSATASPSGGSSPYTYFWTGGHGTNITASGLSAGTYTLVVYDNKGCVGSASATVTQPSSGLSESISLVSHLTCYRSANGSATANPSGGTSPYTYAWTPSGGTLKTSVTLPAGTDNCKVTDAHGCTATASIVLTQPTIISATTTKVIPLCNGNSNGIITATGSGGTPPYTSYVWAPYGGSTATATGLSAQTYSVIITDSKGCTGTDVVGLGQPAAITVSIPTFTCVVGGKGTVVANPAGGTPAYHYTWSNGTSTVGTLKTETFLNGSYTVSVTDNHSCPPATASIIISGCPIIRMEGMEKHDTSDDNSLANIIIYPNPSKGIFTISLNHAELVSSLQTIEVYNVLGEKVYSQFLPAELRDSFLLDLQSKPSGIYFYRIIADNGNFLGEGKLVIQK